MDDVLEMWFTYVMPNLVVYVPIRIWRERKLDEDAAKQEARKICVTALDKQNGDRPAKPDPKP